MSQNEDTFDTASNPPTAGVGAGSPPEGDSVELREARFRAIFEATAAILFAADPEGHFTCPQREWERFTGLPPDDQLGFGWLQAIHPDDRGRFVREWAEARSKAEVFATEVRIWSREQDEYRECEFRSAPLLRGGRLQEWVGHVVDISELRRAQATALSREAMLSALIEHAPIPIFVKNRDGTYALASRQVAELLIGDPDESMVGLRDEDLMPWRVAQAVRAHDEEVLESRSVRVFEEMVPGTDGQDRWWLATKFTFPSETGDDAIAGVAVDVTERKRLAEERAEAIKRRDDFLAMLSHELRNPMQAILHAVRMVDAEDADVSREAKAIIRRQAHHVSRMLADLLDVSRMVHGRINLNKERVVVERIVDAAVETVRPLAESADVEVLTELESSRVRGDETRLVQVLVNLLRNAVSHSRPGSTVWVRAHLEDSSVVLRVEDEGAGIDPLELERIFDPFYQRAQSIARSEGGLGLGLSLGRTLVQLHGGTLIAASEGSGMGSVFTIRLPSDGRPTNISIPAPPTEAGAPESLRFVVVEDNADSREMLALWLRSRGHQVVSRGDGETGLEAILEERPDIAIVDIGLPGLDGYEVARAVRSRWEGPPLKLVAVTGYGREDDRRRVFEAGFDDHLVKPVEVEVLERLLAQTSAV